MGFHDVRFPVNLSFGSVGGPERRTEVVTLSNGYEERNTPWSHSRRRYDAGVAMRSLDDIATLIAFFEARRGQMHGFRWKDWSDFKSCLPSAEPTSDDQQIGIGDGSTTEYQISKTYSSVVNSYTRPIAKPCVGTVIVSVAGVPLAEGSDFSVDYATGVVTLAAPPADEAAVSAGYEFDVPVRFDTDVIQTSAATFQAGEMPNVPIVEIRL